MVKGVYFENDCFQLKTLLDRYEPAPDERPISREMIDTIVRVAENTVDEVTNSEGREVRKSTGYRPFLKAKLEYFLLVFTTLQSIMNAKLSLQGFWHCHENRLIKTIQMIPHNLYVSFKSASLYCGLRLILVYPNPQ